MSTLAAVAIVALAVIGAALAGGLVLAQRRARRQIRELLGRLETLEARWRDEAGVASAPCDPFAPASTPAGTAGTDGDTPPTGDVLAGLTSHVKRLVQSPGSEAESLADQTIVCIHRHLKENVTPAQIADELIVSLRTLERGLAAVLDCSPRQLITAMKMREARRLLVAERRRVSEVAYALGFTDPFHFSKRFKAFYGVAPSEVRPAPTPARTRGERS
jgi:AraC-like DNA-binding protein